MRVKSLFLNFSSRETSSSRCRRSTPTHWAIGTSDILEGSSASVDLLLETLANLRGSGEENIDLFQSLAGGLWTEVVDISGGEEAAKQWPHEDFWANSVDTGATTEDHDPGGEPFTSGTEGASNVAVFEGADLWSINPASACGR